MIAPFIFLLFLGLPKKASLYVYITSQLVLPSNMIYGDVLGINPDILGGHHTLMDVFSFCFLAAGLLKTNIFSRFENHLFNDYKKLILIFVGINSVGLFVGFLNFGVKEAASHFRQILFFLNTIIILRYYDATAQRRSGRELINYCVKVIFIKSAIVVFAYFFFYDFITKFKADDFWGLSTTRFAFTYFNYYLIIIPLITYYIFFEKFKISNLILISFFYLEILISQSRTLLILVILSSLYCFVFRFFTSKGKKIKYIITGGILAVVSIPLISFVMESRASWVTALTDRINTLNDIGSDASFIGRALNMYFAFLKGLEKPILGHGWGNKFYSGGGAMAYGDAYQVFSYLDNVYVTLFVIGGIVAVFSVIYFIYSFFKLVNDRKKCTADENEAVPLRLILFYLIPYFFTTSFQSSHMISSTPDIITYVLIVIFINTIKINEKEAALHYK